MSKNQEQINIDNGEPVPLPFIDSLKQLRRLESFLDYQVGGNHYQNTSNLLTLLEITSFNFGFCITNAFKYIIRCNSKGQLRNDLTKAYHYVLLSKQINGSYQNDLDEEQLDTLLLDIYRSGLPFHKARAIEHIINHIGFQPESDDKFLDTLEECLNNIYNKY